MILLQSDELDNHLQSIIHRDTQQHKSHFDLTVAEIHRFTKAGSLDFGGSEFEPAGKELLDPQKNDGDDYGWWHLAKGTYQATMNEQIKDTEDTIAVIAPHPHALEAGLIANTQLPSDNGRQLLTMNFSVPQIGCNIKENARIAELYLLAR
jgi:hypothetical protein